MTPLTELYLGADHDQVREQRRKYQEHAKVLSSGEKVASNLLGKFYIEWLRRKGVLSSDVRASLTHCVGLVVIRLETAKDGKPLSPTQFFAAPVEIYQKESLKPLLRVVGSKGEVYPIREMGREMKLPWFSSDGNIFLAGGDFDGHLEYGYNDDIEVKPISTIDVWTWNVFANELNAPIPAENRPVVLSRDETKVSLKGRAWFIDLEAIRTELRRTIDNAQAVARGQTLPDEHHDRDIEGIGEGLDLFTRFAKAAQTNTYYPMKWALPELRESTPTTST